MKNTKSKRNFWLTTEIDCMLNLLRKMQRTRGSTATTHYTFVQIANKMRKCGFPNKSPTQIRRKWFQMKSAYLCFKRGNRDRLLLIPEKFRETIAEFVEMETRSGKSPSQSSENNADEYSTEQQNTDNGCSGGANDNISDNSNDKDTNNRNNLNTNHHQDAEKEQQYDCKQQLSDLIMSFDANHRIINEEFKDMSESLMLFEHDCQRIRDENLISFIKTSSIF